MNILYTTDIFDAWFAALRDKRVKYAVQARIKRAECGNFGTTRFIRDGIWEMKIDTGAGYRVYYKQTGEVVYLLLAGGNKSTQKQDIETALQLAQTLKD